MTEKNKELIQRMRSIAQASMGPDAVRVPPGIQALIDGADALEAALAQQPQGEAVAWILEWSDGVKSVTIQDPKEVYNAPPKTITPLYAAPAPASSAPDGQFLRDIILECAPVVGLKADEASAEEVLHLLRRKAEASASPAYKDSTPHLSVGDSSFESWYEQKCASGWIGQKQLARDAYAAGMGDPLVMARAPASPAALTDEQVIARAAQAGFKWLPPDEEEGGFPGGFDMSDIDNMRKLLAASPADQGEGARDAARYRWLRTKTLNELNELGVEFYYSAAYPRDLDKAIDEAMGA